MKKFLIAAAASFLLFSGHPDAQAESLDSLDTPNVETQEVGKWAHFRDKYIRGRETENERRDRKEWERRHRNDREAWERRQRREREEWERRHRHDRDYYPPPPPPPHHGHHYGHGYPPPRRW